MTEGMDAPAHTTRSIFHYVPHPRIRQRQGEKPVKTADEREIGFNGKIGVFITTVIGTMWAAYIFTVLALISLPTVLSSGSLIVIVAWVAQTFLQLVLLPIIIVGQNVISASQDARAEADHLTLTTLHAMNVRQLEMLEQQQQILGQQHTILELLKTKAA